MAPFRDHLNQARSSTNRTHLELSLSEARHVADSPCCVITSTFRLFTQHNGRAGKKFAHNPRAIDANRRSCPNGASSPFAERLQDPLSSVRMDRATVRGGSTSGSLIPRTTLFQNKLCAAYCGTTPVDPCSKRMPLTGTNTGTAGVRRGWRRRQPGLITNRLELHGI